MHSSSAILYWQSTHEQSPLTRRHISALQRLYRSHFGSRYQSGRCALRSSLFSRVGSNPADVSFYLNPNSELFRNSFPRPVWKAESRVSGTDRHLGGPSDFRLRPYLAESTRSHLNSEVKPQRARQVPWWGTARENLRVLLAFYLAWLYRRLQPLPPAGESNSSVPQK